MDKQQSKRVRRTQRRIESENTCRFIQNNTKKHKTPGHDGIQGFCFKKFTSIHDRLEMNRCLQKADVHKWMTKGKTTLIRKDSLKGASPNNYRPITCIPLMWKILTEQVWEEIYNSLTRCRFFSKEQKGCYKGSRGTGKLLYIDEHIIKSKTRRKNLTMAWIDYKMAYDMIPQNVQNIRSSHKPWKPGRWNWQQEGKAKLKWRSKEVYSREMHYHHHYL